MCCLVIYCISITYFSCFLFLYIYKTELVCYCLLGCDAVFFCRCYQHFRGTWLSPSSGLTPKTEAAHSSRMLVNLYQTTSYILEDSNLSSYHCENLKCHMIYGHFHSFLFCCSALLESFVEQGNKHIAWIKTFSQVTVLIYCIQLPISCFNMKSLLVFIVKLNSWTIQAYKANLSYCFNWSHINHNSYWQS
jgi:hypothetical protein